MKYLDVDGIGKVSRIGVGTWQFGSREWGYGDSYADRAALDIVRRARELGITLFDTAEIYGLGRSERILGEALGHERDEVVVASKVFPVLPVPLVVRQRWAGSARRLGLTRIPLYQVHQPNPVVPDSVIMPGMRTLLDDGDIGAAGVSNYSLARWRKADAALGRPVVSNQVSFSLTNAGPLSQSSTRQTSLRTQSPKTCPKHPHPLAPFTPHTQGSTPRADSDRVQEQHQQPPG